MAGKSKRGAPVEKTPWTIRATIAVLFFLFSGTCCGVALTTLLPEGGLFDEERARHWLATDTRQGLRTAADIADGDDPTINGVGALAHLLLWLEHGGDDAEVEAAIQLLAKASGKSRQSPEALYARALLRQRGLAPNDETLADEVRAASETSPWVLLAKARLAEADDERGPLLERAATLDLPLPHATHQVVRHAAATGDLAFARTSLERLFKLDQNHVPGAVTGVFLGMMEDVSTSTDQRRRPTRDKNAGRPTPGKATGASSDEQRARKVLDAADGDDVALVALALRVAEEARVAPGSDVPVDKNLEDPIEEAAAHTGAVAEWALELAVLLGDNDVATRLLALPEPGRRVSLSLDRARARHLGGVDAGERQASRKRERTVDETGISLPLGHYRFAFDRDGWPLLAMPDPEFYPEGRLQRLEARRTQKPVGDAGTTKGTKGTTKGDDQASVMKRLAIVEKLAEVDRAIRSGNFGAAGALLKSIAAENPTSADVALTAARLAVRQGDVVGVNRNLDIALKNAAEDPDVLLTAARLSLDVDNRPAAKAAVRDFSKLGYRSATASSITAMLEAQEGDYGRARAAIAEADRLGGGDDTVALQATILANRLSNPAAARAAADALLPRDVPAGSDIVAAWIAEAAYRGGDQARAEAALKAIVDTKPKLGDAWLFYGSSIAFNPSQRRAALVATGKAIGLTPKGTALYSEAKSQYASIKKPARRRR